MSAVLLLAAIAATLYLATQATRTQRWIRLVNRDRDAARDIAEWDTFLTALRDGKPIQ